MKIKDVTYFPHFMSTAVLTPNVQIEGTQQLIKFPESPKTYKERNENLRVYGFKIAFKFSKNICNRNCKISFLFLLIKRIIIFWNIIYCT